MLASIPRREPPFLGAPLHYFTPDSWWEGGLINGPVDHRGAAALELYELLATVGLFLGFAKVGGWRTAFDRLIADRGPWYRALGAVAGALVAALLIQSQTLSVYPLAFAHLPYAELGDVGSSVITYVLYVVIYAPVLLVFARLGAWATLVTGLRAPAPPTAPTLTPGDPDDPAAWPRCAPPGSWSPRTGWPPRPKRAG